MFDPEQLRNKAKEDFYGAWEHSFELLPKVRLDRRFPRRPCGFGSPHPVFETIARLREAYMRMGFSEVVNPLIVDEMEVHRQFGPEALAVLDRVFYLGGLPRPNVGLSEESIAEIERRTGRPLTEEEAESIRELFHEYKKGRIDGDDLVYELARRAHTTDTIATELLDEVFAEFRSLSPVCSRRTLRSHMTTGWFLTLRHMAEREDPPLRLFSIDRCFRRELAEDATRLMTYFSASCVMVGEDVSVEDGKAVAAGLLSQFGFSNFRFRPDEKRSKYYVPDTQTEVFAYHPGLVGSNTKYSDGWVEVATFGMYSPYALAQYDVPYPVMNLGLGVERLAMILHGSDDLRRLTYPQMFEREFSDLEMASRIGFLEVPFTDEGWSIAAAISSTCERYGREKSPCEFTAWEGELLGKNIRVSVVEPEEGTRLCGPAAFNEIVVHEANVLAIPPHDERFSHIYEQGARTNIKLIDGFAVYAASRIEQAVLAGEDTEVRVRGIRTPAEINIRIAPSVQRHITARKKSIDFRGPVFTTVRSTIL
ncbi:O-phosphoserine--tRNA ligase [Methermicoccus shengliensis]|uniref:O-phosphoserine--tRNA(Cys) ligase n=1 Tax=Methermicoccus shengliensis TaxID=660064 RepID=A0A832RWU4_9EURY|nr:O-phosphoserine--tRNA ligase [Methermicoccus shengliensis]KUK04357.1 MAG: O-phosphoserine--tRNA(Cys) ligase [Euryarchaeota archaeon 55_53]KUK30172.1 MAG: O-phosphoserine--tRNA(Cys) ligase [Methanosarcinales archeaon 56_1174]MDI3488668.1 O-phosphoseryl-tRNA synthetase [Methanosarcinales archaeon]MDN5294775.1 O-phosphoseryl-tRNA synthetase [Methanosarcinales archaeon]HIH69849.1 O-phosphoserine--tRNA ligase [Methermicoccus shengliensis]